MVKIFRIETSTPNSATGATISDCYEKKFRYSM